MQTNKGSVLRPYQLKLMGFLKVTDDASLGVNDQAKELTFEQAYTALEKGENQTEFGRNIDKFLKEKTDEEFRQKAIAASMQELHDECVTPLKVHDQKMDFESPKSHSS